MNYILTIREGPEAGKRFSILRGRAYTVGRGLSCEIMLLDKEVSRIHCIINACDDRVVPSDLESLNGTLVNGVRVTSHELSGGETITIGGTVFEFASNGQPDGLTESDRAAAPGSSAVESPAVESPVGEAPAGEVPAGEAPATEAPVADELAGGDAASEASAPEMPADEPSADDLSDTGSHVAEELEPAGAAAAAVEAPAGPVCPVPGEKPGCYNLVTIEQETTIQGFLAKHPKDTANKVFRWWQLVWYFLVASAALLLFTWDWLYFFLALSLLCAIYLVVAAYRLFIVLLSAIKRREIAISASELRDLHEWDLPVYTVLVPLYKETAVVEKIVHAVNSLDYPQYKLDVKVLLEPDDRETIEALRCAMLPQCVELVVVPDSRPKTKPKACNHGLARARGEYLVIFDAEDRPDPDQLKKAVIAFRKSRKRTICLQAKLNYYNPQQNILTKWFTVEYSTWFDLYLPGLHMLGAPIPLGGTSNHFRTSVLREIGGWDPFNVTEDCDLGIRLHKKGYRTQVFDSTTWEEANSRLGNWIRQRSRWVKGYIQTHLVHMRNPLKTLWQLRPWGFSHFLTAVGGLSLMLLMNPIFWLMGGVYLGLWAIDLANNGWSISTVMNLKQAPLNDILHLRAAPDERLSWHMLYWEVPRNAHAMTPFFNHVSQISWVMTLVLVASNLFFILTHVLACIRRGLYSLIPYALLMPFYWVLISIGAWKGFLQLFFRPFYWEKTVHGLDTVAPLPRTTGRRPAETMTG